MNNFITRNLKGDKIVWMIFILLCIISVVEMFSSSTYLISRSGSITGPIMRHISLLIFGICLLIVTMTIPFKFIKISGYLGLILSWVFLVYTFFAGVEQAGAARFLNIGGFQFQPSEIARISLMIVIADFTHRCTNDMFQSKAFVWYALAIIITCGLIFTENFSTAALLFSVCMLMMFIGMVKLKYIITLVTIVVLSGSLFIGISAMIPDEAYEKETFVTKVFERGRTWVARVENFLEEDADKDSKYTINDGNRQVSHAQIAVASGGLLGVGPGNSVQRNFLPEAYSDFIYAIIIEELGSLIGGIGTIFLYMWLLFRAGVVARKSKSIFTAILVIGVTLMIVLQAFIHMGVAVHLGPVTGQPLPLISRGGTSIIINCIYFGIILSATNQIAKEQDSAPNTEETIAEETNDSNLGDENQAISIVKE